MPHYDYVCSECGHREEVFQKMTDPVLTECPQCYQKTFKRGPGGGIGLQFHGSGFYINDYDANKPSPKKSSEGPSVPPKPTKGCGCGKSSCDA